jgi:hypothetical protein
VTRARAVRPRVPARRLTSGHVASTPGRPAARRAAGSRWPSGLRLAQFGLQSAHGAGVQGPRHSGPADQDEESVNLRAVSTTSCGASLPHLWHVRSGSPAPERWCEVRTAAASRQSRLRPSTSHAVAASPVLGGSGAWRANAGSGTGSALARSSKGTARGIRRVSRRCVTRCRRTGCGCRTSRDRERACSRSSGT